jgi:DNA repair protein RecN (Recombination protein N)
MTSLKNKEEKCIIEAHFEISRYQLQAFFNDNAMDYEDVTILRREILPSGKSRAFVNDSPVNLQELQNLGLYLIDIHSQHQTQELSETHIQFQIIDAIANNQEAVAQFESDFNDFKKLKITLTALESALKEVKKEQDYNAFLLEELLTAKLVTGSQAALENTFEQLNNVEFIKEALSKSILQANEEPFGILPNLKEVKSALQKIGPLAPAYQNLYERVNSVIIEFDDVIAEMNQLSEKLFDDPQQLELINGQLQTIYILQKKHQVDSVDALIAIQFELENKLISVENIENDIQSLQTKIRDSVMFLDEKAIVINKKRQQAIPVLTEKLTATLAQLGMPNVRFNIELALGEHFFDNGKDSLQFLFAANKGTDFGLLKKVASGGEMSRIMLATKAILAQYSKLPTIIFDEIDTGVSGEIANKMGEIMKNMSSSMQVFAITHLPQIAAKGDAHFKVFKTTIDNQTQSQLKLLSKDERIVEIAEMLSGKAITDSALNHAKALLN